MSEMGSNTIKNNGVNGARTSCEGSSPGRCHVGGQRRPGRHQKAARTEWSKENECSCQEILFLE